MTDKPTTILGALAKAQSEITAPTKNREVEVQLRDNKGKYKFKYATLDHLIEHVRGPLTANGLWFIQRTEPGAMVTVITHESGETYESAIPMPNLPAKPQEAGSILTYFRRYSLSIALGLASDEDDDANVAEGNGYEQRGNNTKTAAKISDADWALLTQLIEATKTDAGKLCEYYNAKSTKDLSPDAAQHAIKALQAKLPKADDTLADDAAFLKGE